MSKAFSFAAVFYFFCLPGLVFLSSAEWPPAKGILKIGAHVKHSGCT